MSSTTLPPGPPGPPTSSPAEVPGLFAELVARADAATRAEGAHRLVAALKACQAVINHLNGRMVELVQDLHATYRDQLVREVLDEDEVAELTTSDGGLDLSRSDLFEVLDAETTVDALNDAHTLAIRMAGLEIAAALGCTRREAGAMVRQRLSWSSTPTLVDAMLRGDLELDKATVIAAATSVLDDRFADAAQPDAAQPDAVQDGSPAADGSGAADGSCADGAPPSVRDEVTREVVRQATGLSRRQVAQVADTVVHQRDPAAAQKRHQREVRDRRLEIVPGLECTASIRIVGAPADLAVAAYNRIDALARRSKAAADARTLDQLRGDLALTLMTGTASFTEPTDQCPSADRPVTGHAPGHGAADRSAGADGLAEASTSVGCDCLPGRPCRCECGIAYANPAEFWELEQLRAGNEFPKPAVSGPAVRISEPSATADLPAALAAGATGSSCSEVFPVVPVAPGEVPGRAAGLPETILTVPLETVLGWIASGVTRDENPDPGTSSTALGQNTDLPPAWIERVGPLIDSIARRVVTARLTRAEREQTGEFRIAVTDKQGRVVQYHALHARTLRGLLREAVAADYGTCVFPTCATAAPRCQADHARDYAIVRATRIGNIEPLCGADHRVKTMRGYRIERTNPHDAGSPATWQLVMRSGHRYPLLVNGTRLPTGTTVGPDPRITQQGSSRAPAHPGSARPDPRRPIDDHEPPPF